MVIRNVLDDGHAVSTIVAAISPLARCKVLQGAAAIPVSTREWLRLVLFLTNANIANRQ
jgi:hypothetical protein